ncbi:glycine betaine ABC transporter substrate-binding protein [Salipaludibacillus aurantiacus]|uniref:Osmoprotectant transport system substrate-binding protein n=1 Tax=Salipaludibacillus aurantiacus TaxID=1601833 RepID=A0A1H9SD74_9BACI|nr:glycine betaine ABC transporter substrate-binding protein [Salipaludibacillus aurantiacus]SER82970.1 osmoprotectant transport system substrate-binding protein [Salipaludibacillus aurantiacus]
MKKSLMLSALAAAVLAGCGNNEDAGGNGESKGSIEVGGKNFTEQFILAKITSIYLEEQGYDVTENTNMGSEVLRQALENEQVDLYWEYTGTGLVNYLNEDPVASSDEAYDLVKELDEENGIIWLDAAEVNNTYTLMMREENADELGISSLSDLADYVNNNPGELEFASNAEFASRADGLAGVQDTYDFEFGSNQVVRMDSGLTYQALDEEQVDVAMGFATDSRIKGFDLLALEDDEGFFPAYNAAPTVRESILENHPELEDTLQALSEKLDTETMTELNYQVDMEQRSETEVSREWLEENGLID